MADEKNLSDLLKESGYALEFPNHDILKALPLLVKKRVCALKKLQLKSIDIEAKFYERVHQLEKEFEGEFNKVFEQRKAIVEGSYEPTDAESDIPIIHGATEEELKSLEEGNDNTAGKGIPDFWLTVLKSCEATSDMIQEHDEEILKHLTDITTSIQDQPQGFSIFFHFSPNPFFKNSILKKEYTLQMKPDEEDPFDFDGPSVVKAVGDEIQWEEGKNVTKKVKADSFFNFFEPPTVPEGDHKNEEDEEDDETLELLRADFEIGQVLRDHIVPRAVLFFTGEASDGDMFDDFEDDEDEDDEDEE